MEEAGGRVKIRYVGYGNEFDEWRPKSEVVLSKPVFLPSSEPASYSPMTELACSIKKRLCPSRSEDPEVRIQLPIDLPTFELMRQKGTLAQHRRGGATDVEAWQERKTIIHYSDLDELLGERWYLRITNPMGDFSYVILKTISFHLIKCRPILDYKMLCKDDGTMNFVPVYIEQSHAVVFTFVRGDGNKSKLADFTLVYTMS